MTSDFKFCKECGDVLHTAVEIKYGICGCCMRYEAEPISQKQMDEYDYADEHEGD